MDNVKVRMLLAVEYEGEQLKPGDTAEVPESIAWRWAHNNPPIAEAVDDAEDLSKLNKDELVEKVEKLGVDSSGTKAEIIARLGE